jgi:hypothetical protein
MGHLSFGFVSFQSPDSAKKAKEAMNGLPLGTYMIGFIYSFLEKKYMSMCSVYFILLFVRVKKTYMWRGLKKGGEETISAALT